MKRLTSVLFTLLTLAIVAAALWGWLALARSGPEAKEGPWGGADVNVVERYASQAGREPAPPLINTEQGDLPLFVFAAAGAAGGFAAGYNWRRLMTGKTGKENN
jgi:hypothetical protein